MEAFSAPKELLAQAKARAGVKRMSKSGFMRYCLAKELGYSEIDADEIALHGTIRNLRDKYPEHKPSPHEMNDGPNSADSPEAKFLNKIEAEADRRLAEEQQAGSHNHPKRKPRRASSAPSKKRT